MNIVDWATIIAAVFTCLGFCLAVFTLAYNKIFQDTGSRARMAEWLQNDSWGEGYRSLLGGALNWLESKIDEKPLPPINSNLKTQGKYFLRGKVFTWWFPFSVIYPLVLILLEWVLSGQSGLISDLPNVSIENRCLAILGYLFLFYLYFFILKSRRIIYSFLIFILISAIFIKINSIIAFSISSVLYVAANGFIQPVAALVGASFYAVPIVLIVTFGELKGKFNLLYGVFILLIFPYLNCFFDYLSWGASRWLLHRIAKKENFWWTFFYGTFDLFIGVLCLLGLAFCLPLAIQFFISLIGPSVIDLKNYLEMMIQDPFGRGLGITGMLFTTFIPTIIHLVIALIALCLPGVPWRESTAERLAVKPDNFFNCAGDMVRVFGIMFIPPIMAIVLSVVIYFNVTFIREGVGWFGGKLYNILYMLLGWWGSGHRKIDRLSSLQS